MHGASRARRTPVLIAEGDSATRLILISALDEQLFDLILANDRNAVWAALEREILPKVFLLDWEMPGLDVLPFCRALRDASRAYYPYLLIMARAQNSHEVALALQAGADDYLARPFAEEDIRAHLRVAARIIERQDSLINTREESRLQAMKDTLTGLWSRAAFLELFERELNRAARAVSQTGLMFLDLDHFKTINDRHGHLAGDCVLKEFARRLTLHIRSYDFAGRFGGDEFCVTLPDSNREQLCMRAEVIRQGIATDRVSVADTSIPLSVSIGATVVPPFSQEITSFPLLIADLALYRAKSSGRNCTVYCDRTWASAPTEAPPAICKHCDLPRGSCLVTSRIARDPVQRRES
ncbi:MAG TPA: diguanylate cyclase [Terracidiphilus sp.]|nr:diguanylate cyclase [Terracidiphilus sp.]